MTLERRDLLGGRGAREGEDESGAEGVVGDFTTTALVGTPRFDPADWKGFADYATAVNHRFWEDLDHRSVSGVEVLRELRGRNSPPAGAPSHPVVFTSGVGLAGAGEPPASWIGQEVYGISQTPQVLLDHIVWDEGGRLRLAWDAVEGAFPDGWVPALLDAFALPWNGGPFGPLAAQAFYRAYQLRDAIGHRLAGGHR